MRAYDINLDKSMIEIIRDSKNGEISSGELKRKAEERSRNGKTISSALFTFHLKEMLKLDRKHSRYIIPVLEKRDCGRGSKIYYSLTNSAKKRLKLRLSLLIEESDREKAYQLFFNFAAFQNVPNDNGSSVKLSEEEFEHFLYKIHISRNELEQISVRNKIIRRQIRMSKNKLKVVNEPVRVTTFSIEQYQSDIIIYRIDYLYSSEKDRFYYTYRLPGVSIDDVLSYGGLFLHTELTMDNATEYFELLEQEGLLKRIISPVLQYLDETRFDITNDELRGFIIACTHLLSFSIKLMHLTWKNYKLPTIKRWCTIFYGVKGTKEILEELRQYRLKRNQQLKQLSSEQRANRNDQQKKEIERLKRGMQIRIDRIKKNYSQVLVDYSFLTNMLLEWVYPGFLKESAEN